MPPSRPRPWSVEFAPGLKNEVKEVKDRVFLTSSSLSSDAGEGKCAGNIKIKYIGNNYPSLTRFLFDFAGKMV
jgi:hypothetical protein